MNLKRIGALSALWTMAANVLFPDAHDIVIRPGRTIEKIPRKRTTRSKAARAERRHKREQRAIR